MKTKQKGTVAELAVASKLIEQGWQVLFPASEDSRYDLVAESGGRFVRVQVKYCSPKDGVLKVNCRSSDNWSVKPYGPEEIDVIAAFNAATPDILFINVKDINRNLINIRLVDSKNGQKSGLRMKSDFSPILADAT